MDREVLKQMKQTLAENKTLEKLTLSNDNDVILPKEFCHQLVFGTRLSTCLSEVRLYFIQKAGIVPMMVGWCVCTRVTYCATQLDAVYT